MTTQERLTRARREIAVSKARNAFKQVADMADYMAKLTAPKHPMPEYNRGGFVMKDTETAGRIRKGEYIINRKDIK